METLIKHETLCKNCEEPIVPDFNYCGHCGQSTHIHAFTLPHLFHEMTHAFTHADKGIFLLIKSLLIQPGVVLYEYIKAGKRKKYFNPFTFIVLIGGLILFTSVAFSPYKKDVENLNSEVLLKSDKSNMKEHIISRSQTFSKFMTAKSKFIMLSSIPIISLIFWLGYRKDIFSYAEHLVANCFLTGFTIIIYSLLIIPLIGFTKGTSFSFVPTFSFLIYQIIYYGWGYRALLKHMGIRKTYKPYLLSAGAILFWSIVSIGLGTLYIYWPVLFV